MLGEIYSKAGRQTVAKLVPKLRQEHSIDLVIANGESLAGGNGLTIATIDELLENGVDAVTSGSRVFDQREILDWLRTTPQTRLIRPLNYPPGTPGNGSLIVVTKQGPVEILNLNGRLYFQEMDSPFRVADEWLKKRQEAGRTIPVIVDFHAEATSEKVVLGWYLAGRVSAVLGTHTRTPTADARLLEQGTAHVSDVGMIGSYNTMAGLEVEEALKPFTAHITRRTRSHNQTNGPIVFNSVVVDIEPKGGQALAINRFDLMLDDESI